MTKNIDPETIINDIMSTNYKPEIIATAEDF